MSSLTTMAQVLIVACVPNTTPTQLCVMERIGAPMPVQQCSVERFSLLATYLDRVRLRGLKTDAQSFCILVE